MGKAVVASLHHPSESFDKALKVQSFVVTPKQILAEFQKQTGDEKWDVSYVSLQELKDVEKKAWAEGKGYAVSYTLRRIWAEGGTLYDETDNARIGLKDEELETLEVAVKREIGSR